MTTSARAAILEAWGGPFDIRDIEIEAPRPDEVLVRMVATGICATDAHVRARRMATPLPVVLGHEGAGVVERVGAAVTTVEPGDHVVLCYHSCGRCKPCVSSHAAVTVRRPDHRAQRPRPSPTERPRSRSPADAWRAPRTAGPVRSTNREEAPRPRPPAGRGRPRSRSLPRRPARRCRARWCPPRVRRQVAAGRSPSPRRFR